MAKDIKIKVTCSGYFTIPTLRNGYLNSFTEYNPADCIREDIDSRLRNEDGIEQIQEDIEDFLQVNKLNFEFDINDILDEYREYAVKLLTEGDPYIRITDTEDCIYSMGYDYDIDYEIPVKDFCEMLKNSENRDDYKGLIKALDNLIKDEKSKGQEKD